MCIHKLSEPWASVSIGAPVKLFAYPNGRPHRDYPAEHVWLLHSLGFEGAVSTAWGAAHAGDNPSEIPLFTPWGRTQWRFGIRVARNLAGSGYAVA